MSALISVLASAASLIFNNASSGPARSAASRRSGGADAEPEPSAVLTLSPQAEAMAGFAGKGIMVSQGKMEHALGAVARNSGTSAAANAASAALSGRPVSTQDFQELLARFGADDAQKAQLTAGFDANKDGAITQDEFLKGLAKTQGAQAGTDFSQAVMQLMDRSASGNADGSVAAKEFAAFATAFASAEKRTGVA